LNRGNSKKSGGSLVSFRPASAQRLIGNALLNLATQIMCSKLPAEKADLPANILNTAVQLAVTALKA
jgi:hypothetical protein